jgi:hypothetical protein
MDISKIGIDRTNLASQAIVELIGPRKIDLAQTYKSNSRGASRRGRLSGFLNLLGSGALDYLMSNLTQIITGSLLQLYVFDWNQSDKQIQDQMKANELAMISAAGRLAADGLVRFTALGATKLAKHRYPRIDPISLANLDEENQEELINSLRSFLVASRSSLVNNAMLATYMSGRQMMKGSETKKTESFIIADKIENIAEEQKNPQVKAFLQGFVDQAEDVIFDMAFLIPNTIQATYEMNKLAAKQASGPARLVQLTPDKGTPEIKTLIYGSQDQVMTAITSTVTQQAVLENKDLGEIVQVSLDKAIKADRNERLITAYFYGGNNGASTLPDGRRAPKKELTISNVKNSVGWDELKSALLPISGGNYKVIAHLDDGHQLQGFFLSESEGKSYLSRISNLCQGNIFKWTTIEPNADPKFRVDPTRFEVATATYRILKRTTDLAKKDMMDARGEYWRVKAIRLKLRLTDKPDGIDIELRNPWFAEG